jgi:hypothetical protein
MIDTHCHLDVADFGVYVHVVAARYRHLKLDPELCVVRARLRRERAGQLDSRACGPCLKNVIFQKLLCGRSIHVRFDVHGVPHDGRRARLELKNADRAQVGRQPEHEPVPGDQSAGAHHGRMSSGCFSADFQGSGSVLRPRSSVGDFLEKQTARNNQK